MNNSQTQDVKVYCSECKWVPHENQYSGYYDKDLCQHKATFKQHDFCGDHKNRPKSTMHPSKPISELNKDNSCPYYESKT